MMDFSDFIKFLKNPIPEKQFDIESVPIFIRLVWKSILTLLLIEIVFGAIISSPLRYFNLFPILLDIKFDNLTIIKALLLLPIIEELIFRLPLKISKINFNISLSIIAFLLLYKLIFSSIYLALFLSLILLMYLNFSIKERSVFLNKLNFIFKKYFRTFFYSQAIIFGFLHLTNYRIDFKYFYLFPLFVAGYIATGCFWGYIRIRYKFGIYVCITSHICMNSIFVLLLLH
jgi:hypothetical protein